MQHPDAIDASITALSLLDKTTGENKAQAAEQSWSLSPLTLPHPLVRVVVAESLYRAWSITANHPYHRE